MINSPDTRYLSQVRKFLFCPPADRYRLLEKGRGFLAGYRQENPEAGYEDIVANFGPPADFAATLAEGMYPAVQGDQAWYFKRQNFWLRLAVCFGVLAFALLTVFVLWAVFHLPSSAVRTVNIH